MSAQRARRHVLLTLGAAVVAAAASGITYAATSSAPPVLHACANAHGTLRLLKNGHCPNGFAKVAFNRQGPRGRPGPAGPGAFTMRASSGTSTNAFQDHVIDGMGLTARVICGAQVGGQSALYLLDTDASAHYTLNGSDDLSAPGAHAFLVYNGGSHPNLGTGLGLIEVDQPAELDANAEIVLQSDSSSGGQLTGDLVGTRSGQKVLIHVYLYQSDTHCVAQAEITPAT